MTARKLVSIIIPTWQRHKELAETLKNIDRTDYPEVEVLVISDGRDLGARFVVQEHVERSLSVAGERPTIRFQELGYNTSRFIPNSFGVGPLMVGALLARGEYHTWLCDDERMTSDHLTTLVDLIEESGVDVVAPSVNMWQAWDPKGFSWVIGTDPPEFGQFTACLYRREVLTKAMYRFHIDNPPFPAVHDWDLMKRWLEAGATYKLSPKVTLSHRCDVHPAEDNV